MTALLLFVHRSKSVVFQQDGASVHRSKSTTNFMTTNKIRQFNDGIWPPCSPDMNPIEHVWPLVCQKLSGRVFMGREDLWAALQVAFHSLTTDQILNLYKSMPSRLDALARAKGGHTRY